jgi:flavin-binding protein dodecin
MKEVIGVSTAGFSDAVRNAIRQFPKDSGTPAWFEVIEKRGTVRDDDVFEYQVKLSVGVK